MADLISRQAALAILHECGGDEITPPNMIEMRGRMHRLPDVDAVSRGLFEQIKWERDIAMEQLTEHGIAFGAKSDPASLRPKGEWITASFWKRRKGHHVQLVFKKCSLCNIRVKARWNNNFCPNCGADMRGTPNDS